MTVDSSYNLQSLGEGISTNKRLPNPMNMSSYDHIICQKLTDNASSSELNSVSSKSCISTESQYMENQQIRDARKLNKGCNHRKSYSVELKKHAIALKDSGLSAENISQILGTAKSNVEKWCSKKVTKTL